MFSKTVKLYRYALLFCVVMASIDSVGYAQDATLREINESIRTYSYSDPNPVPVLGLNKKVAPFYPYFVFDGYTNRSEMKNWKIVQLQNPFITVSVLPEVGGKVMGAIENASKNEFVYLNHVMKFRAIGIRGPWTSGGIEHNFGLDLGHAPWAAAPVDYITRANDDGSVSCFVGGLDLASRSEWRVEIRLPKDKAYFETNSLWYNPTPLHHSYLSWENAAFKASDDLEFYFPGNHHIGHDGTAAPWPVDSKGRNLAKYKDNNFGDSKSYHIVGDYRNWFGGYWHDRNFGFGHWAPYADAPGKKLWIWSLSREGAIWEDLLTDNDGQYIEAQSGAILNQAAERSGYHSPFTQLSHRPLYSDTKNEYWFPVKNTGGMSDANRFGTLHVNVQNDSVKVSVGATSRLTDSLIIRYKGKEVFATVLNLQPMQLFEKAIVMNKPDLAALHVSVGNDKLMYALRANEITRPVTASAFDTVSHSAQRLFRMAEEQNSMRNYKAALALYKECLAIEAGHYEALCRVAEYHYRSGEYEEGVKYARKVLEFDAYHSGANFIYGNLLMKQGKFVEAEEALSIASHTMEYRSASYAYIAGNRLRQRDYEHAIDYAQRSLVFNNQNLLAHQFLATAYRKSGDVSKAADACDRLLKTDPLNHYARFEKYLLQSNASTLNEFRKQIRNELPQETYIELALTYANQGLDDEAIKVLEQAPSYPMVYYWLSWLKRNIPDGQSIALLKKAESMPAAFVFPFRLEEEAILTWAKEQMPSWKTNYYLALVYWNNLQVEKARDLFIECGNAPDFAAFYLARAAIFHGDDKFTADIKASLDRAMQLQPAEWRVWHAAIEHLVEHNTSEAAVMQAAKAYKLFKDNPIIAMDYAKSLLNTSRFSECISVLNNTLVLPQEGAQEGHELYEMANLSLALKMAAESKYKEATRYLNDARKWPENLGSGSPYNPDERLHDFIAAWCEQNLGNKKRSSEYKNRITKYSLDEENWLGARNPFGNYISMLALKQEGKGKELKQLMSRWKSEQDSVRKWSITQGNAGNRFEWVFAKYNNDEKAAKTIEQELATPASVSRFNILMKAIAVCK